MGRTQGFPLFAPMNGRDEQGDIKCTYVMCMWTEKNIEEAGFCGYRSKDFKELLNHLQSCHGYHVNAKVDACMGCEIIFGDRLEAVDHYMKKILQYEEQILLNETVQRKCNLVNELKPVFEALHEIHNNLVKKIVYDEVLEEEKEEDSLEIVQN